MKTECVRCSRLLRCLMVSLTLLLAVTYSMQVQNFRHGERMNFLFSTSRTKSSPRNGAHKRASTLLLSDLIAKDGNSFKNLLEFRPSSPKHMESILKKLTIKNWNGWALSIQKIRFKSHLNKLLTSLAYQTQVHAHRLHHDTICMVFANVFMLIIRSIDPIGFSKDIHV